jgi:hypothetical protein
MKMAQTPRASNNVELKARRESKAEEGQTGAAELYVIDLSYKKPRKAVLSKNVTRVGFTAGTVNIPAFLSFEYHVNETK